MYHATREYENREFGFVLHPGDVVGPHDLEPDLLAELNARGVLVREGQPPAPVDTTPGAPDVPEADGFDLPDNWRDMTMVQLRDFAEAHGLTIPTNIRKADLIDEIEAAFTEDEGVTNA